MVSRESFEHAVERATGSILLQLALTDSFQSKLTSSALAYAKLFAQNLMVSAEKFQGQNEHIDELAKTRARALLVDENGAVMQSFFRRTTLDERIFAKTGGSELISVSLLHHFLPYSYGSIRNMISDGTFFLELVEKEIKNKKKNFVRTSDLAKFIENGSAKQKKIGKKSA